MLHLATALAVMVYFRKDIARLVRGTLHAALSRTFSSDARLALALLLGTIPAAFIGFFLEDVMESAFRGSVVVALGLLAGSVLFGVAEYVGKRIAEKRSVTIRRGVVIGLFQALALIPGMSRSGMTISGGLLLGLSREEAARFGFLLSFPIILGAGSLKFLELSSGGALATIGLPLLFGAAVALVSGLFAIHFLISFLKTHSLMPFAVYRTALALIVLAFAFV